MEKAEQLNDSIVRILQQPQEIQLVKLADRISNLQIPPFYWSKERTKRYWEQSKMIHDKLKSASSFLEKRLAGKIEQYKQYL